MATLIVPSIPVTPREDAVCLHTAFKGFGCDTATVVNILAHRDATQRYLIKEEYRDLYSQDLLHRLSKELHGKLEDAILLWMPDPTMRDAVIVRRALEGQTFDLKALTEVICSRTPSQLHILKQDFHSKYGSYLENDVEQRVDGYGEHYKKLMVAYLSIRRHEGLEVDAMEAENDAKALYKGGEKIFGTDEETFIRIFSERSRAHLAAIDAAYNTFYGHSLEKAVKKETSGLFEFALLTILRCAKNPAKYFAKQLRKAMKGLGADDTTLTRVIVTRTEIDMQYIKAEYENKYKMSLVDAVHSATYRHYKSFLLALLGIPS